MNENFEILLERFLTYVGTSKTIDLVSSKFGILILKNVGTSKPDIVVKPIEDFQALAQFLFRDLAANIAEEHNCSETTQDDAAELRRRARPYIADLPNESEAWLILEDYIARLFP